MGRYVVYDAQGDYVAEYARGNCKSAMLVASIFDGYVMLEF